MTPTRRRLRRGLPALLALAAASAALAAFPVPRDEPTQKPADLDRVPRDCAGFLTVRLADLWKTPAGQALRDTLTRERQNPLAEFEKTFGLTVADLERVTVLVPSLASPEAARPWVLLTTARPYDREKVAAALRGAGAGPAGRVPEPPAIDAKPPVTEKVPVPTAPPPGKPPTSCAATAEEDQGTGDILVLHDMLVIFLDERTLLLGTPEGGGAVALMAQALRRAPHGPLGDALAQAGKHLAAGGFNPAGLPRVAMEQGREIRAIQPFVPLLKAKSVTMTLDLDDELRLDVRGQFGDAAAAKDGEQAVQDLFTQARAFLLQGRNELSKEPRENANLIALLRQVDGALRDATVKLDGGQLQVGVRMKVEAALPALLAEAGRRIDVSRARLQGMNNLKQIAIAFHNYHDSMGYLPQAGFPGQRDPNGTKPQLSWRVLILPYIEADNLYQQFHLDEPWDSPHNKRLIAQMPKIYEVPGRKAPPGMTYFQLFTGPDAPFQGTRKIRLPANFPDGLSNTILVAEAGDPVIWTKPDDLVFTKDGPLPKLPEEFLVAMADGSVRTVNRRKVSDQTLRLAIMPADGMPLPPDW